MLGYWLDIQWWLKVTIGEYITGHKRPTQTVNKNHVITSNNKHKLLHNRCYIPYPIKSEALPLPLTEFSQRINTCKSYT